MKLKTVELIFVFMALGGSLPAGSPASAVKSGFITTSDGVRLHYLEAGTGRAIVFEPGWTMPAIIWEPQVRHFSRHYRVIALDPRSQGESAQAAVGHYPERRAQDIKELVDQLKLAPVTLVGWSLGVAEVLAYVQRHGTSTLRAVVLVDSNIGADPSPETSAAIQGTLKSLQVGRRSFADRFVRSMYEKPQPEDYIQKIVTATLKTPTNTAVTLLANFTSRDWRPALSRLDRPVLYAVTAGLKGQAEMLRARIPTATIEIFEDAGHALFVDDAERFNRLLDKFLATLPPTP